MSATYTQMILRNLLEKWEASSQRGKEQVRAIRFPVTRYTCPFYFVETDHEPRAQFICDAKKLEAKGMIRIQWGKDALSHEIASLDLVISAVGKAYEESGRPDPDWGKGVLRKEVERCQMDSGDTPEWYQCFLKSVWKELSCPEVSSGPLSPKDPNTAKDVLRAVTAIARIRRPEMIRSLSVQLFGDSKRLEAIESKVTSVLKKFDTTLPALAEDPKAILMEYGVVRKPGLLLTRGNIVLEHAGERLSTEGWKPFLGIPESAALDGAIVGVRAGAVVTVENEESFCALCQLSGLPEDLLVLYSGGFSNRAKVAFLRKVDAAGQGKLGFFHWGDLDGGGFRILLHMRKAVRNDIRMLFDSPEDVDSLSRDCGLLPADYPRVLRELAENPLAEDLSLLIRKIAEKGVRIEQEAMSAADAVSQIVSRMNSIK